MTRCIGYCICPSRLALHPPLSVSDPRGWSVLIILMSSFAIQPPMAFAVRAMRRSEGGDVNLDTHLPFLLKFDSSFLPWMYGFFYGCSLHSLFLFGFQDHFLPSSFSPRNDIGGGTTHPWIFPNTAYCCKQSLANSPLIIPCDVICFLLSY